MRSPANARLYATAAGALTVALAAAEIPLDGAAHNLSMSNTGFALLIVAAFASVGLVLARRVPANPIGWLLVAFSLLVQIGNCTGDYALLAYRYGHPSLPLHGVAATLATVASVAPIVILPLPILLFPDGRLGARSRRLLRTYVVLGCLNLGVMLSACAIALAHGHVQVDGSGALAAVKSPSGGPTPWFSVVQAVLLVPVVLAWVAMLARQVIRYRRATGLERAQLKWLVVGGIGSMAAVVYFVAGLGNGNSALADTFSAIAGSLFAALPACMGVAILRYRLYDIDRLISRTLSYALLTGLLVGTFVGVVALTTDALALSGRVGVAASTLIAAALFNPLRVRVQRLVDRRFNRARYDAQATVAAFTARLREAVELDAVRVELLDAVQRAVEPSHASVWIR